MLNKRDNIERRTQRGLRSRRLLVGFGGVVIAALAGGALMSSCSASNDSARGGDMVAPEDAMISDEASATAAAQSDAAAQAPDASGMVAPAVLPAGRDIILTVDIGIKTDSPAKAVQTITQAAADNGGYIASTDIFYGDSDSNTGSTPPRYDNSHATLIIRVPTDATATFVDSLAAAGTIVSSSQGTQDVTNQLTDLEIRIANTRDSIESVRALLAKATQITDVVFLEEELNNRVTTLEQLEAQQRGLDDQVAMSTVTITIEPVIWSLVDPITPEDHSIGSSFARGWNSFTGVIGSVVRFLAATAPFLVTGALLASIALVLVRRSRHRRRETENRVAPGTHRITLSTSGSANGHEQDVRDPRDASSDASSDTPGDMSKDEAPEKSPL